ncbi:hypothetical protein NL676_019741 [Syzygium grande]|nr:hypothetical protein NL676_019741 [Syzygium grande]
MPIEPDVVAWGSLLASCRVYKNVELAKFAAEKLLIIDPDNSGAYSALANLYMVCRKWEDAAKVRKSMKDRGVKKEQGTSWFQLRNEVHVFGVEDGLHPQKDAIYQTIDKIWKEIKKMGFVPDTESVMHDLEEEVKEQILRHHSEKLAIAFGLLNTPENTTLRIMKNLRVCNDCHSAIKYIAKLVGREIIVRDSTRFHHFRDGVCLLMWSQSYILKRQQPLARDQPHMPLVASSDLGQTAAPTTFACHRRIAKSSIRRNKSC